MFINANFLTMLTTPIFEKPIETAEELNEKGFTIVLYGSSWYKNLLVLSPDPVYQELGTRMTSYGPNEWDDVANDMFQNNTRWAFLTEYLILKKLIRFDEDEYKNVSNWNRVQEPVRGADPWYVHLVNKKWRYKENFAKFILTVQQVGGIQLFY